MGAWQQRKGRANLSRRPAATAVNAGTVRGLGYRCTPVPTSRHWSSAHQRKICRLPCTRSKPKTASAATRPRHTKGRPNRQPTEQAGFGPPAGQPRVGQLFRGGCAGGAWQRLWWPQGWVACQAWWAVRPSHQLIMPPSVLPAVATTMAGQINEAAAPNRPTTAGSEPMGNKVAEIKAMTNTVLKPMRQGQPVQKGGNPSIRGGSKCWGARLARRRAVRSSFFTASGCPKNEQLQYAPFTF